MYLFDSGTKIEVFGVFDSLYMAHCDCNGTMVRTVHRHLAKVVCDFPSRFPVSRQRSKYGKYYPRGKQKESPAEASGLSPRPTTQLELSIVVSSGTLTCAPKLLFHANNIKNYEFGRPRFYSCSGDKDYSFKRQLQDTGPDCGLAALVVKITS